MEGSSHRPDPATPLRAPAARFEQQARIFDSILSATPDFACVFDLRGKLTFANRRLLEAWGKRLDEIVGKDFLELGYPVWQAQLHARELAQVIMHKQPVTGDVPYTAPTGTFGIYEYTFNPVIDPNGEVECVAGIMRDVTERRQAAKTRQTDHERLSLAMAAAHLGNWDWDPQSDYMSLSPRAAEIYGVSPGLVYTRTQLRELLDPRFREAARQASQRAAEEHSDYDMEYIIHRADGTSAWVAAKGRGVYDDSGKLIRMLGVVQDITARKEADAALRESELQFRSIADAMPQIVWAARPDGVVDYYNRRWFEYVQLAESQLAEARWDKFIYPEDLARVYAQWQHAVGTGEPYKTEFRVRGAAVPYRWFLVRALPIRDENGDIIRWYGTCTDIHDERELQEQNARLLESERAARSEAERSGRMKDEFLATLSHELRTPLNAILGWSQILRSTPPNDEDLTEGLAIIERNARAQTQIIEDLLDMSRIISGKVRLDIQPVDLSSVVQSAVQTVQPAADAKGIRLRTILDPQAGPISGDINRLQQVFWNLLSNAIKFTPRGGLVQAILERVHSHIEVSVIDSGEGIKPEFLPYVFDRFRQADASTTRRHGGLGLGLAIVKQLVELHGGSVSATSSGPGSGSTFCVTIPLAPLHVHSAPGKTPRQIQPVGAPLLLDTSQQLAGVKVLVIDDEPDARAMVRRLLEDCDALVFTAASAGEAWEHVITHRPDVIVSDIGMPGEDGYSLIKKIRNLDVQQGGMIPAIALTAYARTEDRMKAIRAGFQMHLAKPVEPAELITMIASLAKPHA